MCHGNQIDHLMTELKDLSSFCIEFTHGDENLLWRAQLFFWTLEIHEQICMIIHTYLHLNSASDHHLDTVRFCHEKDISDSCKL